MGRGFGSTAPTVALIAAICLLWVYPFCLFHQAGTVAYRYVASSEFDHGSSPPALCDAHVLHAVVTGQEVGADTKAGLSLQSFPPSTTPREQFWVVRHYELSGALPSGLSSVSLASSVRLHSLYAVYQI
ncbi:MAG: hypothetical protein C3F12_01610 [Candidatus Methylomirabilota bacterium]|nr:hypothetical protein [Candidatus Methylomirabilis sp.]NJD69776.1 hypothetical protein [candidate division NC10 bacterium]PWB48487.1 MAG: hypothetical protein C3F12_01610 [candidate division NC10 bacterium]